MNTLKSYEMNNFSKGWFIGPFIPTLFNTNQFECAMKSYKSGDKESAHVHRVATEYTVIATGTVKMNGKTYGANSIIEILPGEATDFEALTDVITFVVKVPAALGDKYLIEETADA